MPTAFIITGLPEFAADMMAAMTTAAAHRGSGYMNADGGGLGGGASATLVVRHAANHLAVMQVARSLHLPTGDLLDVGCGTGSTASTLTAWLGSRLHLCDTDPAPLGVARRAFNPAMVSAATGRPATVLRLAGGPFRLDPLRQAWERIANGGWGALVRRAPHASQLLARAGSRSAPPARVIEACALEPVVAVTPERTASTGLVALVRMSPA
ncbi:hypothetical protein BH23ACT9_BH23ACT9_01020 [soil metagenome]